MKNILYAINCLFAVALIFSYISPFIDPNITWFFSFFGLGFPFLLIANLLFILIWLLIYPRYAIMSCLLLVMGYSAITKTVGLNSQKKDKGLSVMTYNIGNSRFELWKKKNTSAINRFRKFILDNNPDIICIQERHSKLLPQYEKIFEGYSLYPDSQLGTAIYSKYPIINQGNIPFNTSFHNATWADIKVGNKTIRIYCTHLSSNQVPNLTDNVREIWDETKFILEKYNHHAIKRVHQLRLLLAHAKTSPYPVVICGDFNDVPQSYIYAVVAKEYKDAFCESGTGLVQTLKGNFIGLRIDYTFTSDVLEILSHKVIETDISDHYPVMTTLGLDNIQL